MNTDIIKSVVEKQMNTKVKYIRAVGKGASDFELDNKNSYNFHVAMGFEEANRVICFRKELR